MGKESEKEYISIYIIKYIYGGGGLITQSCLTLCGPMDWSPPGSSVPGILQARTPEWVAFPSGHLPDPGIEPSSPTPQANFPPSEPPGKLLWTSSQIRYLYLHAFAHTQYTPRVNLTVTAVSQLISEVRKTLESHFHSLLGMRKPEGCNRCIMNSSGKHQKWWNC